jgi:hypothetical protein
MKRLLEIGFEQVGSWQLREQKLALVLTRMNGQRNVLYAFVHAQTVLYVGKTTGPLESRMGGYLRPHTSQRTNARNHQALLDLLIHAQEIEIYAWADTGMHRLGEFHLNYAAGLEDSIIRTISPPWNGARSSAIAFFVEPTSPSEVSENTEMVKVDFQNEQQTEQAGTESASTDEVRAYEEVGLISASPKFEITLGKTYYQKGFFNVPVKFSLIFPEHGTEISVYCGESRTLIRATVDRKANQANHTPRIYGRGSLSNWFHLYKLENDVVIISVVSSNEIELV